MNTNQSDTPRTDAEILSDSVPTSDKWVSADFARTLERELMAAHQSACAAGLERDQLRTDLQALRARIGGPNMSAECAWHDLIAEHAEGGAK